MHRLRANLLRLLQKNAICGSENVNAFMEICFFRSRDHNWKIPAIYGPIFWEQIGLADIF
tara:strand:- start:62095 stop:62274 length:180 start_codon:yes stop_codon:yes gene_type:complete